MEETSLDAHALLCYVLVLLFAGWVVVREFRQQVGSFRGIARMPFTWLLFLFYLLPPPAIFFLLDHSGAVHDTSIVAAVLVGLGYQSLLSTAATPLPDRAPSAAVATGYGQVRALFSYLWMPLREAGDILQQRLVRRTERRSLSFGIAVRRRLERDEDACNRLALMISVEASPSRVPAPRPGSSRERRARELYTAALTYTPDTESLLYRYGIIGAWSWWWFRYDPLSWVAPALSLLLAFAVAYNLATGDPISYRYWLWRLEKPNLTASGRERAREALREDLREITGGRTSIATSLVRTLTQPGLPKGRTATIQHLLRDAISWSPGARDAVFDRLVDSLTIDDADVRRRVLDTLRFLLFACRVEISDDLLPGSPEEIAAPEKVEATIREVRTLLARSNALRCYLTERSTPPTAAGYPSHG